MNTSFCHLLISFFVVSHNLFEYTFRREKRDPEDEYGMLYDYLDFVTSLSWKTKEQSEINLQEAEEILDEDHYGLKKVKERIIQQLAVMALNKKQSGSILLFVGAPGTGKTSIGQSIARALHREYPCRAAVPPRLKCAFRPCRAPRPAPRPEPRPGAGGICTAARCPRRPPI